MAPIFQCVLVVLIYSIHCVATQYLVYIDAL